MLPFTDSLVVSIWSAGSRNAAAHVTADLGQLLPSVGSPETICCAANARLFRPHFHVATLSARACWPRISANGALRGARGNINEFALVALERVAQLARHRPEMTLALAAPSTFSAPRRPGKPAAAATAAALFVGGGRGKNELLRRQIIIWRRKWPLPPRRAAPTPLWPPLVGGRRRRAPGSGQRAAHDYLLPARVRSTNRCWKLAHFRPALDFWAASTSANIEAPDDRFPAALNLDRRLLTLAAGKDWPLSRGASATSSWRSHIHTGSSQLDLPPKAQIG